MKVVSSQGLIVRKKGELGGGGGGGSSSQTPLSSVFFGRVGGGSRLRQACRFGTLQRPPKLFAAIYRTMSVSRGLSLATTQREACCCTKPLFCFLYTAISPRVRQLLVSWKRRLQGTQKRHEVDIRTWYPSNARGRAVLDLGKSCCW
jgi:hypothetical protein